MTNRMDSGMDPPKYEEVVLTPPNSSVYAPSAPGQYNLQILPAPDQEVVLTPPKSSVYTASVQCQCSRTIQPPYTAPDSFRSESPIRDLGSGFHFQSNRMDSDMNPPKYEEVLLTPPNSSVYTPSAPRQFNLQILPAPDQEIVLTPPNSSVFTVSAPRQYNLQIPDQSPPPQVSSPQVKFSTEPQSVSCPSCQQEVVTEVDSEVCRCMYVLNWACLICTAGAGICFMLLYPARYTHSCPRCQATIAKTGYRLSACSIIGNLVLAIFIFLTIIYVNWRVK